MALFLCEMVGGNVSVDCSDFGCDISGQDVENNSLGLFRHIQPRADSGGLGVKGLNNYSGLLQNLGNKNIMIFIDFL